ncbi:caspase family protein [Defluviimonas sp. SAOS-178_SWC]|uniref:caspase family protein n=1 Tax=Defluviimonas sp. SAOS-178_SWC TaxID=3121287 RepID=UPI003221B815
MFRLVLLLALLLCPSVLRAENRVALVIGNDRYAEVPMLEKAVADATAMAARLSGVGFRTQLVTDAGRREMNLAVAEFTARLQPGDTAVVFYAGHGVEIDGENYLLPADISAPSEVGPAYIEGESIALSRLLDRIRATGARTTLAVIDACRDNPFAESTGRSIGSARGLGRIAAPEGTFVVFSAGAGQQALDRLNAGDGNTNSVFTRSLLPKIGAPGLELRQMISEVRVEVRNLALGENHAQFPAYYDELLGECYFSTGAALAAHAAPLTESASIRVDFDLARQVGTEAALRAFLSTYADRKDDFSVQLAERMLEETSVTEAPERVATADPAPKPAPVQPSADDRREVMRATQAELNRLGCYAGGVDGIAGRRTQAAFARFIAQTSAALAQRDLSSDKALAMLRAAPPQAAPAQPAPATAPQLSLVGSWAYVATCPLFVKTIGSVTYRASGGNGVIGNWNDSIDQRGTSRGTQSGRTFLVKGSVGLVPFSETGTVSADGQSYTSTSTMGCRVAANRM